MHGLKNSSPFMLLVWAFFGILAWPFTWLYLKLKKPQTQKDRTKLFIEWYVTQADEDDEVLMAPDRLQDDVMKDATGKVVAEHVKGNTFYFVDRMPEANWAHPCWYVFVGDSFVTSYEREMPPGESISLVPLHAVLEKK